MFATVLKALGALGSIASLLKTLLTDLMGLFIFRKGEEAQAAKDTQATLKDAEDAQKTDAAVDRLGDAELDERLSKYQRH